MSSLRTIPLPPATLTPLVIVYRARGLVERTLASSIGTTHPHVGRIMSGKSRPSMILAGRIGVALGLPEEFISLMVSQSSTVGRKMRFSNGFADTVLAGSTPCPRTSAYALSLMHHAFDTVGEFEIGRKFSDAHGLWSIGVVPAMGSPETISGKALDPWHEFNTGFDIDPLIVWEGDPKPPHMMSSDATLEFISSIPSEAVVRCTHHV